MVAIWLLRRHLLARTSAAAKLFEQRERFRTTLASIGDAVIATDPQGGVTFLNDVAQKLTGWRDEDAAAQPIETVFRIVNEETRATVENPALRAAKEGRIVGLANHTVLLSRNGTEFPIDDSAAPIRNQRGEIIGTVLVFRDITTRRNAERALREADRLKDEFLATLAHELRGPLAPISNSVEILKAAKSQLDLESAWSCDVIARQVRQMARLLDDLLDVSRITRGKLQLRKARIVVSEVVAHAVETSRPLIVAAGHMLDISLPPEPLTTEADPARLAQIISNLLSNAAKYTDPGGQIRLSVTRENSQVVISVKDNGIGLDPRSLPDIFNIFAQSTTAIDRAQGGLGIGLSLVRSLVALHGGTVDAHSEGLGKGSEFVVRMPGVVTPPQSAPGLDVKMAELTASGAAHRILVAEDQADSARSLVKLLRLKGHVVELACDGRQALEQAERFKPEIALLDIGMPQFNGYEVARHLRKQPWGREMTLVALTGWGQEEDRRRAMDAGFDRHIVKPVDTSLLFQLLSELRQDGPADGKSSATQPSHCS